MRTLALINISVFGMDNKVNLLKIFDAIKEDNRENVRLALYNNLIAEDKISIKELCGVAILAAESNAVKVTKELSDYSRFIKSDKFSKFAKIALKICEKNKDSYRYINSTTKH